MANAAITYANDDHIMRALGEKIFPAVLKKAGVPVVATVDFKLTAFDVSAQMVRLKENPSDLVALGGLPETTVKLA